MQHSLKFFSLFNIIIIFLFFHLKLTNQSFIIPKSGIGEAIYIPTPTYKHIKIPLNFTLEISRTNIISTCKNDSSIHNVTGIIAFVVPGEGCSEIQHILIAQEAGAAGVILLTDNVWLSTRLVQRSPPSIKRITIPAVYMKLEYFRKYFSSLNENSTLIFKMEATPNDLDFVKKGAVIFYQIVVFFFIFVSVGLCIKKIIELQKFNLMGSVICSVCILANIFFFIYCIDPLGFWGRFTNWDILVVLYLGLGFMYIMFLLICIYFSMIIVRITNNKVIDYSSKILFGIILAAEIALDISTIVFALNYTYNKFKQRDLLYWRVAVSSVISIFYLVGGTFFVSKINTFFSLKSDKNKQRYTQYYRLGFCVIILGLIMIFMSIVTGLFTVSLNSPNGFLGLFAAVSIANSLSGVVFFFMFIKHKRDKSTFTHFTDNHFSKNASSQI